MSRFVTLLSTVAMLTSAAALAQPTQDSHATAPGSTISPEKPQASRSANLAQSLSRTNGTITPPQVDQGMAKTPPPNTRGNMPVLHPPPNVQSK